MKIIKEKVKILQCNLPTGHGRVYPREEIEKAISQIQEPVWGFLGGSVEINIPRDEVAALDKVAFLATNFLINEQDELVADINLLDTSMGRVMKPLLNLCDYTIVGTGIVSDEKVISDFRLFSISAYPKQVNPK